MGRKFAFARSSNRRSHRLTAERQLTNSLPTETTRGGMAALAEEQPLPKATFTVQSCPIAAAPHPNPLPAMRGEGDIYR